MRVRIEENLNEEIGTPQMDLVIGQHSAPLHSNLLEMLS